MAVKSNKIQCVKSKENEDAASKGADWYAEGPGFES
jgi:hypothetical protein